MKEYKTVCKIAGPLVFVEKTEPVRGTCKQYSKNAMPQEIAITPIKGKVLNHENSAIFKCPYHAKVINTFDATKSKIV